jgi:hypothetical protein
VAKLLNRTLSATAPTSGQDLAWNATTGAWTPADEIYQIGLDNANHAFTGSVGWGYAAYYLTFPWTSSRQTYTQVRMVGRWGISSGGGTEYTRICLLDATGVGTTQYLPTDGISTTLAWPQYFDTGWQTFTATPTQNFIVCAGLNSSVAGNTIVLANTHIYFR